jgi:putative colanic acid biosynthesis acetyltransferase WcaF
MIQQLECYRTPSDWQPGASLLLRTLWFCAGAPLLSARWLPGSAWRVALLRSFGARIGSGCRLKPGLRVKFPWRLQVGRACWLAEDAWPDNLAPGTGCLAEHPLWTAAHEAMVASARKCGQPGTAGPIL